MGADWQLEALRRIGETLPIDARRELSDCVLLGKPIRTVAPLRAVGRLDEVTERLGVSYRVSGLSFELQIDPGMQHWSSAASACSDATSGAMRFIYLHKDLAVCDAAEAADRDNDDSALGRLLQYPLCCVEAFVAWRRSQPDCDPIGATIRTALGNGVITYDGPNPFSRYLAGGLISHFPCSLTCEATCRVAGLSLQAFRFAFPASEASLLELERCFTAFQPGQGVCSWPQFNVHEEGILLEPESAIGEGLLADRLRHLTRIDDPAAQTLCAGGMFLGRSVWTTHRNA